MNTTRFGRWAGSHKLFLAAVALAVAAGVAMLALLARPMRPLGERAQLWDMERPEEWTVYTFADGDKLELTYIGTGYYTGPIQVGDVFYSSRVLDYQFENAILRIENGAPVAVFLDDELVYAEEAVENPVIGEVVMEPYFSGIAAPLIALPADYPGKTLTIARPVLPNEKQEQPGEAPQPEVFMGYVTLESRLRLDTGISSPAARVEAAAVALSCLGGLFLLLLLYNAYHGRLSWDILFFSGFLFLSAAEICVGSDTFSAYYPETGLPASWLQGWTMICLFLFMAFRMRRFRAPMFALSGIMAAWLIVQWATLAAQGPVEWLEFFQYYLPLAIAASGIVFEFLEAARGNRFARLFTIFFEIAAAILAAIIVVSWAMGTSWFAALATQAEVVAAGASPGYFLTLLRYLLMGGCSAALGASFIRDAVQRGIDRALMRERAVMAEKSTNLMREHAAQTAVLEHDMRKHLGVISLYLQSEEPDRALEYLRQMGGAMDAMPTVVLTGNPTVDLIMNAQSALAREKGLRFSAEAYPLPELPLTETELASLLLNTLENAFRAALDTEEKTVGVRLYTRSGFFCYSCENARRPDEGSERKPEEGHGYGLRIIRDIAEREDGILKIECEPESFLVSIVFPLAE